MSADAMTGVDGIASAGFAGETLQICCNFDHPVLEKIDYTVKPASTLQKNIKNVLHLKEQCDGPVQRGYRTPLTASAF